MSIIQLKMIRSEVTYETVGNNQANLDYLFHQIRTPTGPEFSSLYFPLN